MTQHDDTQLLDRFNRRLAAIEAEVPSPPRWHRPVTTQSPKWRFHSIFSATKFVVAGATVSLFGGFLLAGVLTQPSEESPPAAVTASPEPTVGLLPGVDLVTEEVESGVYRVLGDEVRELSRVADDEDAWLGGVLDGNIVAGLDGSVWWLGPEGFLRLGDQTTHAWPVDGRRLGWLASDDFAVTLDGTLWRSSDKVSSFDGDAWIELDYESTIGADDDLRPVGGLEARADGTVWITWVDP